MSRPSSNSTDERNTNSRHVLKFVYDNEPDSIVGEEKIILLYHHHHPHHRHTEFFALRETVFFLTDRLFVIFSQRQNDIVTFCPSVCSVFKIKREQEQQEQQQQEQ